MSFELISFVESDDPTKSRVGGLPLLESANDWPLNPENGQPLLFLCSIVGDTLSHLEPKYNLAHGHCISVFICFDNSSRKCARALTVHDQDQIEKLDNGYSRVFLHRMSDKTVSMPNGSPPALPQRGFVTSFHPEVDQVPDMPDCGVISSKIGGKPAWAQDIIEIENHKFALQLNETEITAFSERHAGIFGGGIGLLFLDSQLQEGCAGKFFVQFT